MPARPQLLIDGDPRAATSMGDSDPIHGRPRNRAGHLRHRDARYLHAGRRAVLRNRIVLAGHPRNDRWLLLAREPAPAAGTNGRLILAPRRRGTSRPARLN